MNVPHLAKNRFDGKAMLGMRRQVPALAGLSKESRFFANHDHKCLFRIGFPSASTFMEKLGNGGDPNTLGAMVSDPGFQGDREKMGDQGRQHLVGRMQHLSGVA